jgi:hypothetical protein
MRAILSAAILAILSGMSALGSETEDVCAVMVDATSAFTKDMSDGSASIIPLLDAMTGLKGKTVIGFGTDSCGDAVPLEYFRNGPVDVFSWLMPPVELGFAVNGDGVIELGWAVGKR